MTARRIAMTARRLRNVRVRVAACSNASCEGRGAHANIP